MSGDQTGESTHLTAEIDGGEVVEPMMLELQCGKRKSHPEAQKVIRAGREKRLRGTECGKLMICKFGEEISWHFARHKDEPPCTHADQSEEHRAAVIHLELALSKSHGGSHRGSHRGSPRWQLRKERKLKRVDRRSDILAYHPDTRTGVVFECQRSPLTRGDWRPRRQDYSDAGIARDYWFTVGSAPPPKRPSTRVSLPGKAGPLARMFSEKPDQRVIYLAVHEREGDGHLGYERYAVQAYELFYRYKLEDVVPGVQRVPFRCRSRHEMPQGAFDTSADWKDIALSSLRLDGAGSLSTELDEHLSNYAAWREGKVRELRAKDSERREREEREARDRRSREQEQRREHERWEAQQRWRREQEYQHSTRADTGRREGFLRRVWRKWFGV